jgi:hypothetical protein
MELAHEAFRAWSLGRQRDLITKEPLRRSEAVARPRRRALVDARLIPAGRAADVFRHQLHVELVVGGEPTPIESGSTMAHPCRQFIRSALAVIILTASAVLAPAAAAAAELGDYLWQRRPLLLFAPAESDSRLVETVRRIEASRCDFADRDMVLGLIVTEGTSTLDGQVVDTGHVKRLLSEFGIAANTFSAVLIGKDGGEKLRVNDVPDLPTIYAVIDGMPMRSAETGVDPGRC